MRQLCSLLAFAVFAFVSVTPARAASEKVLYAFTGGVDGGNPIGSLVRDSSGNLYGTTYHGGASGKNGSTCYPNYGCGTVFELTPLKNGKWKETVIYNFCPVIYCVDGSNPTSGLVMDAAGNLYGATYDGGLYQGGVVFELVQVGGTWVELVLHNFCSVARCLDGLNPKSGLLLDSSGNLWGTTSQGGGGATEAGAGVVFEISPVENGWLETVLYSFCAQEFCPDGAGPNGPVAFDLAGNLYGTAIEGGLAHCPNTYTCGTVFRLTPAESGYWPFTKVYDFCPAAGCLDGDLPAGGTLVDLLGNVYSTASSGGTKGYGVLFLATPSGGGWDYNIVHDFCSTKNKTRNCTDGASPSYGLLFDSSGNLYGTTGAGGTGGGGVAYEMVNELTGWKEKVLHSFCTKGPAICEDGDNPSGTMLLGPANELYGVTAGGGAGNSTGGGGVVFQITL